MTSAPPTTWLLVRISPSGEMMTPEPRPPRASRFDRAGVDADDGGADLLDDMGYRRRICVKQIAVGCSSVGAAVAAWRSLVSRVGR